MPMITNQQIHTSALFLAEAVTRMAEAEAKLTGRTPKEILQEFWDRKTAAEALDFEEWKREKYGDER